MLPLFALLGCGVLYTSKDRVEAGVNDYLQTRYGESFVITRVDNNSNAGAGFVDSHSFTAHPVSDPSLSFQGRANYDADPPVFSDGYACVRVKQWVVDAVLDAIPDAHHRERTMVRCRSSLPAHPTPEEALPEGSLAITLDLQVFVAEPPVASLEAAHAMLSERAETLGIELDGSIAAFPEALWPFVSTCVAPPISPGLPLQDWKAMQQASMAFGADQATETPRDPAREAEVATAIRELLPDARVAVWARRGRGTRLVHDIRVSATGLDADGLERVRTRLDTLLKDHTWSLRGIDTTGPQAEQTAAFTCFRGPIGCKPTRLPLLDPDWEQGTAPACVTEP